MKIKILTSILQIGLLSFLVAGGTLAYFTDEKALPEKASFEFSTVKIAMTESSDTDSEIVLDDSDSGSVSREVAWLITNQGTEAVRLRVQVQEQLSIEDVEINTELIQGTPGVEYTTMDSAMSIQSLAPDAAPTALPQPQPEPLQADPRVDLDVVGTSWVLKDDGYYYYTGTLAPDADIEFKIELTVDGNWTGKNGTYEISVTADALQVSNTKHNAWPEL